LKETVHALLTGSLSFTIELVSLLHLLLLLLLRILFLWVLFLFLLLLLLFCSSNRVQYHTPAIKQVAQNWEKNINMRNWSSF
jgi:hypothetical protein